MRLTIAFIVLLFSTAVHSQEFPGYGGVMQSQKGSASVTWRCKPSSSSPITCTIAETQVEHPTPTDLETEVERMLDPNFLSDCAEMDKLRSQLSKDIQNAETKGLMDSVQVGIVEGYFSSMSKICANPTRESVSEYVAKQNAVEAKTCKVTTTSREMTFDWNGSSERWENISIPLGACGQIDIVALEKANPISWNMRRQSIITNRSALRELGGSCSAEPDKNEVYEWATRSLNLGCQFIEFAR